MLSVVNQTMARPNDTIYYACKEELSYDTIPYMVKDDAFLEGYNELREMLIGKEPCSLKRAEYIVEWAYSGGKMDYSKYINRNTVRGTISTLRCAGDVLNVLPHFCDALVLKFYVHQQLGLACNRKYGLENHPYTEAVMSEDFVKNNQNVIRSRGRNGKYTNVGRPEFFPWQASPLSPMQFIGTYRYDGYSSKNDLYINNVVTDSKSVTSLGYHIPFLNNHRRSQRRAFGNTYQFYIKRTRK